MSTFFCLMMYCKMYRPWRWVDPLQKESYRKHERIYTFRLNSEAEQVRVLNA